MNFLRHLVDLWPNGKQVMRFNGVGCREFFSVEPGCFLVMTGDNRRDFLERLR